MMSNETLSEIRANRLEKHEEGDLTEIHNRATAVLEDMVTIFSDPHRVTRGRLRP